MLRFFILGARGGLYGAAVAKFGVFVVASFLVHGHVLVLVPFLVLVLAVVIVPVLVLVFVLFFVFLFLFYVPVLVFVLSRVVFLFLFLFLFLFVFLFSPSFIGVLAIMVLVFLLFLLYVFSLLCRTCVKARRMGSACAGRATSRTGARSPQDHPSAPSSARICLGSTAPGKR